MFRVGEMVPEPRGNAGQQCRHARRDFPTAFGFSRFHFERRDPFVQRQALAGRRALWFVHVRLQHHAQLENLFMRLPYLGLHLHQALDLMFEYADSCFHCDVAHVI